MMELINTRLRKPCLHLIVFVLLLGSHWASAQQKILFDGGTLNLSQHMIHWVPEEAVSSDQILTGAYDPFFRAFDLPYLTQNDDNWFKITLYNPRNSTADWVIDLHTAMIHNAELFFKDNNHQVIRQVSGFQHHQSEKLVPYSHLAFSIQQAPHEQKTYYLKINTPFQIYFSPTLSDHPSFLRIASINYSFGNLFIGFLLGIFIYLMVLLSGHESRKLVSRFIWFVFFSILVILYVRGYLINILPVNKRFTESLWLILHIGLQISYLLATKGFFKTQQNYPKINTYLNGCIFVAIWFFIALSFIPYHILVTLELYFAAQLIIAVSIISIYVWFKEKNSVALFSIGNIGLMVTAAMSTFAALSSIAANDWIVRHGYEIGFCWQAAFFTAALSQQINRMTTDAAITEAKSRSHNEFIAKMSHEIRVPLNAILSMTELIGQSTPANEEQKHHLRIIEGSGKTLLSIVNDILNYSRFTSGKFAVTEELFSLDELLDELNTIFEDVAIERHLSFNIIVAKDTPSALVGDSIRTKQVLTNLLSNAFKYTDRGSIVLKIKPEQQPDLHKINMVFSIRDTGIGISPDDLSLLFENFSQLKASGSRRQGGFGLGLSICKQWVEALGGTITVQSQQGSGSEFICILPFKLDHQKALAPNTHAIGSLPSLAGKKILLAEDDAVNREIIAAYLNKAGCEVMAVENGRLAVSAFENHIFDAALLDYEMPVLNGIEACIQMRAIECTKPTIKPTPIIALSGHDSLSFKENCLKSGFSCLLLKPVSFEQLKKSLSEQIS